MSTPVFHRFGVYGPVCGTRDGVNAGEMDPPEITCRRCWKAPPPQWWERWQIKTWRDDTGVWHRHAVEKAA